MTTATETAGLVGADVDRVDGPSKVTGAARYPADFGLENLAHAVLVQSTVAAGRIRRMATAAAEAAPGVLTVITHRNAPRLARAPGGLGIGPPPPLQDDRVVHHGQHIAVVVAQTLSRRPRPRGWSRPTTRRLSRSWTWMTRAPSGWTTRPAATYRGVTSPRGLTGAQVAAFCIVTAPLAGSVRGAQNGTFCRVAIFWRMRVDVRGQAK